jgi:4-amino-4-deoxy-L-arabinose transferase-like glycosyltransferase
MDGEIPSAGRTPRRFLWLRIAVSVFFAILGVASIGMWVRSHFCYDNLNDIRGHWAAQIGSNDGTVHFMENWFPPGLNTRPLNGPDGWRVDTFTMQESSDSFGWIYAKDQILLQCPYWLITPLIAAAACLPWIKRFSLRTMLVVTALVAVLLGLVVWLAR